jgi:hypothetical protein
MTTEALKAAREAIISACGNYPPPYTTNPTLLMARDALAKIDAALAEQQADPSAQQADPSATVEQHFQFTDEEIRALRVNPSVLRHLMDHHDCRQAEADAIFGLDEGCPQGNALRKQALYERGRSLMAADLDVWSDDLRRAFGFPTFATSRGHK